jgi:hypothetical protein
MTVSCRRKVLVAAGVLLLLGALSAIPEARAENDGFSTWAAVAYSPVTGRYGYGRGFYAEINARRRALNACDAADARVIAVANGSWVALALGDNRRVYGYGLADTAEEARRIALRECRRRTSNCHIVVCVSAEGATERSATREAAEVRGRAVTPAPTMIVPAAPYPVGPCWGPGR